jgi:parallel beta-helix repeat protein
MKTKMYFLLCLLPAILFLQSSFATKWRVNNSGVPADFTSIQAAHDASGVVSGDTIYLESSSVSYGSLTSIKNLIVIGPGYFLGENDSTQANVAPAMIGTCTFSAGSGGSVFMGVSFIDQTNINAGSILLKRVNMGPVNIGNNASNVMITGSFIYSIFIYDGSQNIILTNNVFISSLANNYGIYMYPGASGTVTNNIFQTNQILNNCIYRNNIATGMGSYWNGFYATNSTVEYNIGAQVQFPTGNGNQQNVDMSTVFLGTGSTDGRWRLKSGSPAIGSGYLGVDCGPYGGGSPYVLSGMPNIPAIWLLDVNGLNVTVKAKSH